MSTKKPAAKPPDRQIDKDLDELERLSKVPGSGVTATRVTVRGHEKLSDVIGKCHACHNPMPKGGVCPACGNPEKP